MGSVVGYGLLVYLLLLPLLRRRRDRLAVVLAVTTLVLLIGFSRVYLRAHYLSDVIGGFALGAAWLGVCIAILPAEKAFDPLWGKCYDEPLHPRIEKL
jgi:undecaprenyl-diphosphatase